MNDPKHKIKVCGMTDIHEISQLVELEIDFIGLIFYDQSARFFTNESLNLPKKKSHTSQIVGVFVNSTADYIISKIETHHLDYVQLHGEESSEYCENLRQKVDGRVKIIKAFGTDNYFNFEKLKNYTRSCNYFLFDTKGEKRGGNGIVFDWQILSNYALNIPFFISGGIGNANVSELLSFHHPYFYGIDVNSKLEISPGKKNIPQVVELIKKIRS